jgi:tetratricopeptide (TPR) repeat protein
MTAGLRGICVSLVLALAAVPATAQIDRLTQNCGSANGERRLKACNALIEMADDPAEKALAYSKRSRTYEEMFQHDRAMADLQTAYEIAPDKRFYGRALSREHYMRGWNNSLNSGRYDEARARFAKALAFDPGNISALIGMGASYAYQGEDAKAIEQYSAAIAVPANDSSSKTERANAYTQRAHLLVQASDYDQAIADYEEAKRLEPHKARFYTGWQCLPVLMARPSPEAAATCDQAIAAPDVTRQEVAPLVLFWLGRLDDAEKQAKANNGTHWHGLRGDYFVAMIAEARGDTAAAQEKFDKIRQANPKAFENLERELRAYRKRQRP